MEEKYAVMTLREVMEYTRCIPIRDGGLGIFIEKLVDTIEKIVKKIESDH